MTDQQVLAFAEELYAAARGEFTALRDAQAKRWKADADLAAAVKSLRKPSLAAWVVNLLVRREADQVTQVLAVGEALRSAAADLDGDELRALTRQRRQLTAAVAQRARVTAAEAGVRLTSVVLDQVEDTLTAAMLDAGAGSAVRSGLLVTALAPTGIEPVDVSAAVALPQALGVAATPRSAPAVKRPELSVVPDPEPDERAREDAVAAVKRAEEYLGVATAEATRAQEAVAELEARALQTQAEIDEVRARLDELEQAAADNEDELAEAEETHADAAAAQSRAAAERQSASDALASLTATAEH